MEENKSAKEEVSKEVFFAWSKSGVGPKRWAATLERIYAGLAAEYRQLGMDKEAALFNEVVEEFEQIQQKIAGTNGSNGHS